MEESGFDKKTKGLEVPDQSLGKAPGLRVPRANRNLDRTPQGSLIMNQRNLRIICETDGLYEYPQMNNKIYLHYKVIQNIYGLEKYINLKTLYLQNNVIRKIQNLDHLDQLENLFLQNNMITNMEGFSKLKELKILNLTNNTIFTISGLFDCSMLQSLTLSKNYLSDFASYQHLGVCSTQLTSIDLSDNKIVQDQRLFDLIPQVKLLYLSGNPLVKDTNHYRRTVVGRLKNLMYLDQRGADPQQKMQAQAWVQGGQAGFKAARQNILINRKQKKEEERKQIMLNIDVHRKKKINVFESNIIQFQKQIQKNRSYMRQPGNEIHMFFYQSRIAELMQKIKQNQDFIDSIYKRMGIQPPPAIYSIELELPQNQESTHHAHQVPEAQLFPIEQQSERALSEVQSQGHSEDASLQSVQSGAASAQSGTSGPQTSSNSQQSLQTYNSLDDLD